MFSTVAFFVVLAIASPSEALERARASMDELEFERALDDLKLVVLDPTASDDERLEAYLLGGVAAIVLNRHAEARLYFLSALKMDPHAALPPAYADSPRVAAFFALVKNEADPHPPLPAKAPSAELSTPTPERPSTPSSASPDAAPASMPWGWAALGGGAALVSGGAYAGALAAANVYRDTNADTPSRESARGIGVALVAGAAVGVLVAAGAAVAFALELP